MWYLVLLFAIHTCNSQCEPEIATTGNCELNDANTKLNDANTKLAPEALKEKEGLSYYEPARSYNSENVLVTLVLRCFSCCNSQCEPVRMCEKVSVSLGTDRKPNYALDGYVLETLCSIPNWQVCQNRCLKNCQCLSFNFKEIATTGNCELNDANTKLAPEALKEKKGVDYYEPVRSYNSENLKCFFILKISILIQPLRSKEPTTIDKLS
ncbi:hypothetical protein OS493_002115 [Desmophyllum pertusum]|uniref:Apple domain-containing protein n=1 Tax=Desmophyllum pertusum TaxID=174260 RepID=A0A9W9Z6K4_9CNID|nr:hypothetical protein OS493_002115 [Desmophyllum pertusum]